MIEGWGNPQPRNPAAKFHYFVDGVSLCKKWTNVLQRFELVDRRDNRKGNCTKCKIGKKGREK